MKDILIIANFCRDFSPTDNGRFMYLCKELSKKYKVEIVTSDFQHRKKQHKKPLIYNWPFKITFLHEPGYKKNISIQRFTSHRFWGKEVGKYLKIRKKPDVIYCAVPSLTAPAIAAKYCEVNNIRFIIDVQDLWPEAFRMVFNIPVISSICFFPFKLLANRVYKKADEICAVSETYCKRALQVNKKCANGITVFLGTDLDTFDRYAKENAVLNKNNKEMWIAYCGTLGASYDLICVIDAIALLEREVKFIVMGDGPRKDEFQKYAKQKGINAEFTGRLPYDKMCGLLSACDIAVNPITHRAAQSIINKHADYAAAGLPVVSTQENKEYRNLVNKYQMGLNCKNNSANDLSENLEKLIINCRLRNQMANNARKCAVEIFDRKNAYIKIENILSRS